MIRFRGVVQYEGGELVEWQAGSAAMVRWERFAADHGWPAYDGNRPQTMTAFLAYCSLSILEGFDVWMGSVVDVDGNPTDEMLASAREQGIELGETVPPIPEGASPA